MTDKQLNLEPDAEEETLVLTDDEDNEITFRVQGRMHVNDQDYIILEDLEDEGSVLIFGVNTADDGTEELFPIEDEDECQLVFDYFQADFDDYEFCDAE